MFFFLLNIDFHTKYLHTNILVGVQKWNGRNIYTDSFTCITKVAFTKLTLILFRISITVQKRRLSVWLRFVMWTTNKELPLTVQLSWDQPKCRPIHYTVTFGCELWRTSCWQNICWIFLKKYLQYYKKIGISKFFVLFQNQVYMHI